MTKKKDRRKKERRKNLPQVDICTILFAEKQELSLPGTPHL